MTTFALIVIAICTTLCAYMYTGHCKHKAETEKEKEKQYDEELAKAEQELEDALNSHNLARIVTARANLKRLREQAPSNP